MHKIKLHQLVWFPYRQEQALISPLVMASLIVLGAAGIVKSIDIFTSFISGPSTGWELPLALLLFCLSLLVCMSAARSDYLFPLRPLSLSALLPCTMTIFMISLLNLAMTLPKSNFKSALVQSGVATFVALGLGGKIVQSGGANLGELGALYERTRWRANAALGMSVNHPDFRNRRIELVADVVALSKALKGIASEVTQSNRCNEVAKRLDTFVMRSRLVDDDDFKRDISEGNQALDSALQLLIARKV